MNVIYIRSVSCMSAESHSNENKRISSRIEHSPQTIDVD